MSVNWGKIKNAMKDDRSDETAKIYYTFENRKAGTDMMSLNDSGSMFRELSIEVYNQITEEI